MAGQSAGPRWGPGDHPRCPPLVPEEGKDLAAFPARCHLAQQGSSGKLLGTARWASMGDCSVGCSGPGPSLGPPFPQAAPLLGPRGLVNKSCM